MTLSLPIIWFNHANTNTLVTLISHWCQTVFFRLEKLSYDRFDNFFNCCLTDLLTYSETKKYPIDIQSYVIVVLDSEKIAWFTYSTGVTFSEGYKFTYTYNEVNSIKTETGNPKDYL